jgi:hypothetical protein
MNNRVFAGEKPGSGPLSSFSLRAFARERNGNRPKAGMNPVRGSRAAALWNAQRAAAPMAPRRTCAYGADFGHSRTAGAPVERVE